MAFDLDQRSTGHDCQQINRAQFIVLDSTDSHCYLDCIRSLSRERHLHCLNSRAKQRLDSSAMASVIQVSNETKASFTRSTKDGRTLTYELQVLQQPQRARACGSGAKCRSPAYPVVHRSLLTWRSICGPTTCRPSTRCRIEGA